MMSDLHKFQMEHSDDSDSLSHKKSDEYLESKRRRKVKKEKIKSKKKKKHHVTSSSSDETSESETAEWVEKKVEIPTSVQTTSSDNTKQPKSLQREEWMSMGGIFPCMSKADLKADSKEATQKKEQLSILDKPGQSDRELNPYWKDGGTGLPIYNIKKSEDSRKMDPNWLRRGLQRAQEQALEEGRSLEEVAAERWGSLDTIKLMIRKAEDKLSNNNESYKRNIRGSNYYDSKIAERNRENYRYHQKNYDRYSEDKYIHKHKESKRDLWKKRSSSREREVHKSARLDSESSQILQSKQMYQKPKNEGDSTYATNRSNRTRNWLKDKTQDSKDRERSDFEINRQNIKESKETDTILSKEEMNKLGAKIVKAELMGDMELANQLKAQLEKARELSAAESKKTEDVEHVTLSRTDSKGVTRPIQPTCESTSSTSKHHKKKKVETHVSGERVRYFMDDDKYSLQQLFQREKGRSASEDDAMFIKNVSKNMNMRDMFDEEVVDINMEQKDERDRTMAIKEHKRISKSLEGCSWCIESKNMLKHMIVSMDSHICLSLPSRLSLVKGHCILTPVEHISCQLQLDENVWERLKDYKQTLVKMFMDQKQRPIFFEIYKNRHKFPHMQLECVPLPEESADLAPMYFKKALLECETEWAINKKIVNLHGKDIRRGIPNGLPYFMVQFGNDEGFAHVIEDERMFPRNFAEEIVGGILDLDHNLWHRPKRENFEEQRSKVMDFSKMWEKYNHLLQDNLK